jgi:hypothetical protein
MDFGMCPNCINRLTEDSALITSPSSIFKGNNVYMLCKNCQQVLLYNKDRDMVFDLDDFKDDDSVIEEINMLLEKIDSHYEVPACSGDCQQCAGCHDEQEYTRSSARKATPARKKAAPAMPEEKPEEIIEDVAEKELEDIPEMINITLDHGFLAVNKIDPSKKLIILEEDLNSIKIDEWVFFELTPVTIKAITTYEIERH